MKNKKQAQILATAIYSASKDKKGKELDLVIDNFVKYLKNHRSMNILADILAEVEKMYLQDNGILKAEVVSKTVLTEKESKIVSDMVHDKTGKKVIVESRVDQEMLGGVVVKYQDKIIDASLNRQLSRLAKQLAS